jgi:hypothetical protein
MKSVALGDDARHIDEWAFSFARLSHPLWLRGH